MKPIITPTVGRQVWFRKGPDTPADFISLNDDVPMAATVIFVDPQTENMVALDVIDHAGNHHHQSAVNLEPAETVGHIFGYAEWMPYQKSQAVKQIDIAAIRLDLKDDMDSATDSSASTGNSHGS